MPENVTHTYISNRLLLPPFCQLTEEDYIPGSGNRMTHAHSFFQILALISGDFRIRADQQDYELNPGDCILLPAHIRHSWASPAQSKTIQILMQPVIPEEYGELSQLLSLVNNAPLVVHLEPKTVRTCHADLTSYNRELQVGNNLMILSALMMMLGHILRTMQEHLYLPQTRGLHPGIQKVMNHILRTPDGKASLPELARMAGLSVSRFSELFREATGNSPVDFMILRRMEHAKMLLRTSNASIYEIVEMLGFESVSYFSRKFKALYDCPPGAFRKQYDPQLLKHRL